jgi:hypothetical protein
MTLKTSDGTLNIFSGASRSGKTALCVRLVTKRHKNALIWDTQGQWSQLKGYKKVANLRELADICKAGRAGRWCFVPSGNLKAEFEVFCACAYHYVAYHGECGIVAEEVADVTTVGKAPNSWGILLRRSLKYGAHIYPISQRWAEADKTAIGNATDFYLFRSVGQDVGYMAKRTRIAESVLADIQPLQYVHYSAVTGAVGQVTKLF